ncbi:MAG: hypothetical protein OEW87_15640, partial [Flavobacteriaceae bacterium]|nr:hypothetical protein [Flavobacteriaceae bacterium]
IMKKLKFIIPLFSIIFLINCGNTSNKEATKSSKESNIEVESATIENAEYDLTSKGIPVIITGPAGAEIKDGIGNMEFDGIKTINYNITKGNFNLSVTMTDEDTEEGYAAELLSDAKMYVEEEDNFRGYIKEEANGFIYKIETEDGDDYNFYYQFEKGSRIIEFEAGLNIFSEYTLEEIETIYSAAKTAK